MIFPAAGILGNHIQLRCRHVKNIRPRIVQLDIVLFNAVHLHFDNAGKAADPVCFMDDIIADGEIGKVLDTFSVRRQLPALLSVPAADQLRIRQNRQMKRRIFHPGRDGTDADAAFAFLRQRLQVRTQGGFQPAFLQKRLQYAGPSFIASQNDNAVMLFPEHLHIFRSRLGVAGVGRQLFGRNTDQRFRPERPAAEGKSVPGVERVVFQLLPDSLRREAKAVRVKRGSAFPLQILQIFAQLFPVLLCHFADAGRLIGKNKSVFRNIVEAGRRRIKKRQPAIPVGHAQAAANTLGIGAQRRRKARTGSASPAAGHTPGQFLEFSAHRFRAARAERRQRFLCRKHQTASDTFLPALGRDVKGPHRVDFIAPEFHAHGPVCRRRKQVQDAAAARKLPGAFHLFAAFISAADQRFLNLFRLKPAGGGNRKRRPAQDVFWNRPLQHGRDGRHGDARSGLFRCFTERIQGVQTLLFCPV